MQGKRITLSDIAKRAGVHVTTVSLALRNHRSLPDATRQRIAGLAQEMGYVPDPNLSALVAYRRTDRVPMHAQPLAYVTNWMSRDGWREMPAHAQFFEGATEKSRALGYKLDHFWLGEPGMTAERLSTILSSRGIAGLIFASHHYTAFPIAFDWRRFCAVKIDYFPPDPPLHYISNDQLAIMQLAFRKTRSAGYRRIGLVLSDQFDIGARRAWSAGFFGEQDALPVEERIPILRFDASSSAPSHGHAPACVPPEALRRWLDDYRPEVVVSYGPFVRPAFEELRLRVPDDIAFVDLFVTAEDGGTAGVRENCRRVGEVAVEVLVGQLQQNNFGLPSVATCTLVEGRWVDGASLPEPSAAVFA